ncbi:hypothetical protein ACFWQD_06685 [Alcaligenes faecalis]|uniref:hypothetical protein n=1 Tax=Alcaligenes TaxID=507 RepID=UPI002AA904C2|nr:hypothetical protein [Alcaligenes phenolicus]
MRRLNRLISVPKSNSREMRAYFQAILEVTGLLAGEKYKISLFMENYRTHLENSRLLKDSDGFYSLTDVGRLYFNSRLTESPLVKGQNVSRSEVIEMISGIVADEPGNGWERI